MKRDPGKFPDDGPDNAVLLVEGADDFNFLFHFMNAHDIIGNCTVRQENGIENVLKSLRLRLRLGDVEYIGIVVDADQMPQSRWDSIKSILTDSGYDSTAISPTPMESGTIIATVGFPVVGVWIMPNNLSAGMLEHFAAMLIPPHDTLWPLAVNCVDAIPESERRFIPEHLTKAQIHTWLAWQQEPGKPIGQALAKRYFDADAPLAVTFSSWIQSLFPTR